MIKTAIKWSNGMTMAFDENGQQIPEYQGRYDEMKQKILDNASEETVFEHGDWKGREIKPVSREAW